MAFHPDTQGLPDATVAWRASMCLAFALAVWGAKLWLISRFANPTPFADEWDAHALGLLAPYSDSTLSWLSLLSPHNEHRYLSARLVALGLFAANGAWDPILEMIVNAAIHVALGMGILLVLGRHLDRRGFAALAAITAALLSVPNAIENPMWGIETPFYTVLLFGFIAIDLLCRNGGSLVRLGVGIAAGALAFLSLASGALVFLAAAAVAVVKNALRVGSAARNWAAGAALLACLALTVWLTPVIEANKVLRVHTAGQFVFGFETLAAWPFRAHITAATLLVNAPLAILAWRCLRKPPARDNVAWVLLGLGLWNGLQFAAIGVGRAATIEAPRYLDICAFNLIVNFAGAAIVADSWRKRLMVAAWLAAVGIGWGLEIERQRLPQQLAAHQRLGLLQERNVRAYLATGAFLPGTSVADWSIPYPNAAHLADVLSNPTVRKILPSTFQDAAAGTPSTVAPDRLRGVRDGLLRAGPWLGIAGALLMLLTMVQPLLVSRFRSSQAFAPG
jgi:hypothetical protein